MSTSAKEVWCGACGFDLSRAVESGRCPECGRPIVETLTRKSDHPPAIHYRSRARILGMPALAISRGLDANKRPAHARGWIAIGPRATGLVAIGGKPTGIVAIGGLALGVFAAGGMTLGVFTIGGVAIGLLTAIGGCAASLGFGFGGVAIGGVAMGGMAIGIFAAGGQAIGPHTIGPTGGSSPQADEIKRMLWSWIPTTPNGTPKLLALQIIVAAFYVGLAILLAIPGIAKLARDSSAEDEPASAP